LPLSRAGEEARERLLETSSDEESFEMEFLLGWTTREENEKEKETVRRTHCRKRRKSKPLGLVFRLRDDERGRSSLLAVAIARVAGSQSA
jgi:hypothetical protein